MPAAFPQSARQIRACRCHSPARMLRGEGSDREFFLHLYFPSPHWTLFLTDSFSNIIAIYLKKGGVNRERIKAYRTDMRFVNSSSLDISCRLICKMQLICNDGIFDPRLEQTMSLTIGIIQRLQKNGFFKLCEISDKFYKDISEKKHSGNECELVHLIAMKNVSVSQSNV